MNHETLQALYALDVAEVGEGEAVRRTAMFKYTITFVFKDLLIRQDIQSTLPDTPELEKQCEALAEHLGYTFLYVHAKD